MQQRKEVPSVVSEVNVFTVQVEADGDNGHTNDEHGHRKTSKAASVGVGWGIRPPRRGLNNGRASGRRVGGQAGGIRGCSIRGGRKTNWRVCRGWEYLRSRQDAWIGQSDGKDVHPG
jgi:hypothetical protein